MSDSENQNPFKITAETFGRFNYRTGVEPTYIYVTPATKQFNFIGLLLGIGVIIALCFFLWMALSSRRRRFERPALIIYIIARSYYWQYVIIDEFLVHVGLMTYVKTIHSRPPENNPIDVEPLVVPYNCRIYFAVIAEDLVICRWVLRLQNVRINLLASPGWLDGKVVRMPPGTYYAFPYSQAGYPYPNTPSMVMPIVVQAVSESGYTVWFLS